MASGGMIGATTQGAFKNGGYTNGQTVDPFGAGVAAQPAGIACPKCGKPVTGKFCADCGTNVEEALKEAAPEAKTCPKCGKPVEGKFCTDCGTKVDEE